MIVKFPQTLGLFVLFSSTLFSQTSNVTSSQKKIALVIGNGNYQTSILANPENDARAIKDALQYVGFIVMEYENLNQVQMKKAIDDFGAKLKSNEVGLFFYAGHGIQSKGYNYLIPVDAQLQSEQQIEYDCVQTDRVLALMEASGTKVNIIILDACRNNPFERSWTRSTNGNGLAFMNAPRGSLIAYATSPGSTASDGSGNNGLYTSAILESIKISNITILEMFQNVRNIVSQKSNYKQTPWESTSLTGNFYFNSISSSTQEPALISQSSSNPNIISEASDNKELTLETMLQQVDHYTNLNNFEEALRYINLAKKKDPNNFKLYWTTGVIFLNQKKYDEAINEYSKCFDLETKLNESDEFEIDYGIGASYINKAVDMYVEANKIMEIDKYKIAIKEAKSVYVRALPFLEKANKIKPEDLVVLKSLQELYNKLKQEDPSFNVKYEKVTKALSRLK